MGFIGGFETVFGIAAICGLEAEARLLRPLGIDVTVTAGDTARGMEAAERAAVPGGRAQVSFGIAGGIDPALPSGALLLPRSVRSENGEVFSADETLRTALAGALLQAGLSFAEGEMLGLDQVAMTRAAKAALFAQSGAVAVDTESLFVARAAHRAGVPFLVLRAVADPAERELPPAASVGLDAGGRVAFGPVLRSVARSPKQIPGLIAVARDTRRALAVLEAARDAAATVFSARPSIG
jgi:hopanoid-associated phosphorylase